MAFPGGRARQILVFVPEARPYGKICLRRLICAHRQFSVPVGVRLIATESG